MRGEGCAAAMLPGCVWQTVALHLEDVADLVALGSTARDFYDLVWDPCFQVRYWRENLNVWDVLRYKRDSESWSGFLGRALLERQEYLDAFASYTRALERGANGNHAASIAQMYTTRGLLQLTNLRDFHGARRDFEEAARVCPPSMLSSVYNNLAVVHLYLGNLRSDLRHFCEAEKWLRRGEQVAKSSVSGGNLCVALIKQGRFEEALQVGREATEAARVEEPGGNANAFHHFAFAAYSLSLHDFAVRLAGYAIRWKPTYSEAYFTRGLSLLALGRKAEAQEDFEKALCLSRASSVWSYVHMYSTSGEPCCEGFAPRQQPPASGCEWIDDITEPAMPRVQARGFARLRPVDDRNAPMQLGADDDDVVPMDDADGDANEDEEDEDGDSLELDDDDDVG